MDDTTQDGEDEGRREENREASQRTTLGHEIWEMGETWVCRRCGRQSEKHDVRRMLKSSPCFGSAGGRAVAHATGNRNYIWNRHALSATGLQEQGARMVQRSGIPGSMIDEDKLGEMEGTYAEKLKCSVRGGAEGVYAYAVEHGDGLFGGGNEDGGGWRPWEEDPQWLYLPHLSEERGREAKKGGDTEAG